MSDSSRRVSGIYTRALRDGKWQLVDLITEASAEDFRFWIRSNGLPHFEMMMQSDDEGIFLRLGCLTALRMTTGREVVKVKEEWMAFLDDLKERHPRFTISLEEAI